MKYGLSVITSALLAVANAQVFSDEIPERDKRAGQEQAISIFNALNEITQPVGQVVFQIYSYRASIGYGISLGNGRLLAKWSELGRRSNLLVIHENKAWPLEFEGIYEEHDLVVLKAQGLEVPAAKWANGSDLSEGAFLAAVRDDGEAQGMGVVSVKARSLRDKDQGFLGVSISRKELKKGVLVIEVTKGSAAEKAGIQPGDVITTINGEKVKGFFQVSSMLRRLKAGTQARINVMRDEQALRFKPILNSREAEDVFNRRIEVMDSGSGTRNQVRDDFPNVIQSDMELEAEHHGMPVVDMKGRIVGMVIARAGRISTLILPGEVIRKELKEAPAEIKRLPKSRILPFEERMRRLWGR